MIYATTVIARSPLGRRGNLLNGLLRCARNDDYSVVSISVVSELSVWRWV